MSKQTDLKKLVNLLQRDSNNVLVLFTDRQKKIKKKLKRLKQLAYGGDKQFANLFNLVENGNFEQTPSSSPSSVSCLSISSLQKFMFIQ